MTTLEKKLKNNYKGKGLKIEEDKDEKYSKIFDILLHNLDQPVEFFLKSFVD